ncbi:cyclic pyranopterin monophosphate synthase MoaC [Methanobacterium alcaliphilum]|uniref:cyclic pyranopterin monophosphate synthase MoaC n=1 Tax=Methanobacterium alcaliphilum TaxID=392018 RepID=UPI00200B9815|nr:cyclic pyranopterin monophosphate synthase MoaC [Methanobacterium alcaliphilum]MCK9150868.1 cyclic pyranopterin monophosphate synthase MoaC [Methanobacterium alcaliphilum]
MSGNDFTHLTKEGVHMVEVGNKPTIKRRAIASGKINLKNETIALIQSQKIKKGNVLTTAQIAAINAVKNTSNLIPLCHPLPVTGIEVDFLVEKTSIVVTVSVNCVSKTGVEMEAITGVSVALLTIWDMTKSVEKDDHGQYPQTKISDIVVLKKEKKV